MMHIRSRILEFYKKMSVKQVLACTFVETLFIIMIGVIVSVVIPQFEILRMDFVFIVVAINFFEMLSVIREMFSENKNVSEMFYWTKFSFFSIISILYLMLVLEFRQLGGITVYFANLKVTLVLTMVLILGMDLIIDKIDQLQIEESNISK